MYRNLHENFTKKEVRELIENDDAKQIKWYYIWDIVFIVIAGLSYKIEQQSILLWIFGGLFALKTGLLISIEGINRHYFLRTIDYLNAKD